MGCDVKLLKMHFSFHLDVKGFSNSLKCTVPLLLAPMHDTSIYGDNQSLTDLPCLVMFAKLQRVRTFNAQQSGLANRCTICSLITLSVELYFL